MPTLHLGSPPGFFGGVHVAHLFSFDVMTYYISLRFEFRVLMSVTISTQQRCSPLEQFQNLIEKSQKLEAKPNLQHIHTRPLTIQVFIDTSIN